jgi:2-dehydropantoate 2-reductase
VRLGLAGAHVICVARADAAAAIARTGLTLECRGETLHTRPDAVERLDQPVELLVVAVKAFGLVEALERIDVQAVADGVVLPLLNGLEHVDVIRGRLGPRVAVGSIGRLEAYRRDSTTIMQTTPLPVVSLASDTLPPEAIAPVFDLLRAAGVDVQPAVSEKAVLWEKAVRLAPLAALTTATQQPVGALLADSGSRATLRAAIEEASAVAAADGVAVEPGAQWEIIEAMPATLTTSSARDVAAGRPSELDAIVGAVVRAGLRLGVATPTLDGLLAGLVAA